VSKKTAYPLEQVLDVKKKRVEDAERIVSEKLALLEKEKKKLTELEEERDKVKNHYGDKLQQLRDLLDSGTTSPKIQQMKAYIKVVQERLKIEEKKVKDQQVQVENATKAWEIAKEELKIKRQEVDKLETHKEDWSKEQRKESDIIEGREQDELGAVVHQLNAKKYDSSR